MALHTVYLPDFPAVSGPADQVWQVWERMKATENQWQVEQRSYKHLKKESCDGLWKRDLVLFLLQESFQLSLRLPRVTDTSM